MQGFIHQDAGKTSLLPSFSLTPGANLYPVVFLHLASTTGPVVSNNIDRIQCSFDPFSEEDGFLPWYLFVAQNPGLEPKQQDLPTVVKYDANIAGIPFEPNLRFGSQGIAAFLGYTDAIVVSTDILSPAPDPVEIGGELVIPPSITLTNPFTATLYTRLQGWIGRARNVYRSAIDSESFLVDTQTFMLDSYDSYGLSLAERNANAGGSRRNLLATIPVEEVAIVNSANNRVIYEPNTLDYIAIRNKSDIITRQIRMRLLNARYEPITTAGLAAMTILIKEPYTE